MPPHAHPDEPVELLYHPAASLRIRPRTAGGYHRSFDVVYAEAHGTGLIMDVFAPAGAANGLAIVDVVSGGWHSDRVRLNEHIGLGLFDEFCARGFTVFAVMPGSATVFTGWQMVRHVHAAIRHVRAHAAHHGIDPGRIGLAGASAGGNLAALAALQPEAPAPHSRHAWKRAGSEVQAVGLFFPPTDLIDFGGHPFDPIRAEGLRIDRLLFADGLNRHGNAGIAEEARRLSPALIDIRNPPPFLLVHGDADPVVPLEQSQKLLHALQAAGGHADLIVRPGGGHPWPGIQTEIAAMAQWFAERLGR